MKITIITEDDQFKEIEFEADSRVIDIKEVLQIEFGIPVAIQELFANNKIMNNSNLIREYCGDNDMIRLSTKQNQFGRQQMGFNNNNQINNQQLSNNAANIANALSNLFGNSLNQNIHQKYLQQARDFKNQVKQQPFILQNLQKQNPKLAQLLQSGTDDELAQFLQKTEQERIQKRIKEQQELDELEKDPFNAENQKKIEEIINQRVIDENLEMAQEYIPEVFGKITMLYIDCVINDHPIQAFVDTGAKSTSMSKACAERCGLMRLVDKRFSGMAIGVGTGKIIGRIHKYAIQILDKRFECSFTILEAINLDFLLGLDNLRRFQCNVNLRDNTLNFWLGDSELKVPFLHEKDIKKTVSIEQEQALFDEEQKRNQEQPPLSMQRQSSSSSQIIGGTVGFREDDIEKLINLGATREQAINALKAAGGNVELAASILTMKF
ncbi:hypothetical protein ABPG74_015676 [Tetrahymena malaccensis]